MAGVERQLLDRIGDEVARATSFVRYAPNSEFPPHSHGGGEEILVLEGEFADEHGSYPAGYYLRNPVGTSHTPSVGSSGALIFVKLRQFDPEDRTQVKIDMTKMETVRDADRAGVSVMPLFQDSRETVRAEVWDADADVTLDLPEGGEFLVLDGSFEDGSDRLGKGGWLRLPEGSSLRAKAGPQGARVWMKLRHIPHAKPPAV